MRRNQLLWSTFAVITIGTACGLKEKAGLKGENKNQEVHPQLPVSSSQDSEKLNEFVQAAQTQAEQEAQAEGAFDGQVKSLIQDPSKPASPRQQIIDALKMARSKTLEILGISDKPLQELKATLAAIKTLCQPSIEDCRKKTLEAREKFSKQMADMKVQAEKARVEKKRRPR